MEQSRQTFHVYRGRGERCKSITQTPPRGSRLSDYVTHLEKLESDGPPDWDHPDERVRAVAIWSTRSKSGLHGLPLDVIKREIIAPHLSDLGMPAGLLGAWLDYLIDAAAKQLLTDEKAAIGIVKLTKRQGHPKPKAFPILAIFAAFLDEISKGASGRKNNNLFEATARRLGPGINRDHVRRVIKPILRRLGSLDQDRQSLLLAAGTFVGEIMRGIDQTKSAPKSGAVSGF